MQLEEKLSWKQKLTQSPAQITLHVNRELTISMLITFERKQFFFPVSYVTARTSKIWYNLICPRIFGGDP